jgi:hypothetical protein
MFSDRPHFSKQNQEICPLLLVSLIPQVCLIPISNLSLYISHQQPSKPPLKRGRVAKSGKPIQKRNRNGPKLFDCTTKSGKNLFEARQPRRSDKRGGKVL